MLLHLVTPCHTFPRLIFAVEAEGLVDIATDDWSEEVAPFWGAVIQTALTGQGLLGLMRAGWTTIKVGGETVLTPPTPTVISFPHFPPTLAWQGALVMPLMAQGFNMGLIKFNIITARKPKL